MLQRPSCWTGRCRTASIACGSASRRLLGVDVHVLRVAQQADALLLLSLFCHLKTKQNKKKHRRATLAHDSSHLSRSRPLRLTGPRSQTVDMSSSARSLAAFNRSNSESTASNLASNLSSDEGRIHATNNESRPDRISEIKQSEWVITQVWNLRSSGEEQSTFARN